MITLTCKVCGAPFDIFPCEIKKNPNRAYCTRACYLKDDNKIVNRGEQCYNFIKDVPPFEIKDEIDAYFLGFLQTDGTLDRKRASIEIGTKDIDILHVFQKKFGGKVTTRTRSTNFLDNHQCSCWRLGSVAFVKQMNALGIPCGKKSEIVGPISTRPDLERHYVRGLVDGDGSLCFQKSGNPLVGFVTASEKMKLYFQDWLSSLGIQVDIHRNARDNIYSFCILNEKAQLIVKTLYDNATIFLPRKKQKANQILTWKRPEDRRRHTWRITDWSAEEDEILSKCNLNENAVIQNNLLKDRTKASISMRCWRLKKKTSPAI